VGESIEKKDLAVVKVSLNGEKIRKRGFASSWGNLFKRRGKGEGERISKRRGGTRGLLEIVAGDLKASNPIESGDSKVQGGISKEKADRQRSSALEKEQKSRTGTG